MNRDIRNSDTKKRHPRKDGHGKYFPNTPTGTINISPRNEGALILKIKIPSYHEVAFNKQRKPRFNAKTSTKRNYQDNETGATLVLDRKLKSSEEKISLTEFLKKICSLD